MKQAKFNPIPENPGAAVSYDPSIVAKMGRADFGKSSIASLLFHGQELSDEYKAPFLDAWHADAVRLAGEKPAAEDTGKTKTK